MTLSDFVKTLPEGKERTVINTYAQTTHVTMMLPMVPTPRGIFEYDVDHDLPYEDSSDDATRVLNGEFTATKSSLQPFAVNYKVYGGKIAFDRAAAAVNPGELIRQQRKQVQAKARQFTKDVFEGTGGRYLRGIKNYINTEDVYKPQIIYLGTPSTGSALTEDKLDEAISIHNVGISTYFYCTRKVGLRVKKMSRGTGSTNAYSAYNINYRPEEFGTFAGAYDGIPIVPLIDGKGNDILSTTSDICTAYLVTYGADENFTGFQVKPVETHDLEGTSAVKEWDIEHLVGTAPQAPKSITMLQYVANSQS
jgi:hypothetical protein